MFGCVNLGYTMLKRGFFFFGASFGWDVLVVVVAVDVEVVVFGGGGLGCS